MPKDLAFERFPANHAEHPVLRIGEQQEAARLMRACPRSNLTSAAGQDRKVIEPAILC